jgi:hypothetical protein
MHTQVRHAFPEAVASGGSWCGSAQNSKSQGSAIRALSLRSFRNASCTACGAQAIHSASDLGTGRIEVEFDPTFADDELAEQSVEFSAFIESRVSCLAEISVSLWQQADGLVPSSLHFVAQCGDHVGGFGHAVDRPPQQILLGCLFRGQFIIGYRCRFLFHCYLPVSHAAPHERKEKAAREYPCRFRNSSSLPE